MRRVVVNDKMQRGYRYECVAPIGRSFDPEFQPELTPREMLRLGVFGGKYMTDCRREFPASWFTGAKLASGPRDSKLNFFSVRRKSAAIGVAQEGMGTSRRPARLVPMVLSLLHGAPYAAGGPATDQTLEGDPPARAADRAEL